MQLPAGSQRISGEILIPQTDAWTFYADDNKLTWKVTLRVDIPNWPDWVATAELELIPSGDDPAGLPETPLDESEALPPIPIAAPVEPAEETPPAEPEDRPETPAESASDGPTYAEDLKAIVNADRFGSQRDDLIRQASERTYDLAVTMKSKDWTMESSLPSEYRNGRTIIATVEDTQGAAITIHLPENANDEIDALSVRTTLRLTVRPRGFNEFYDRMETLAENP
jgi:hypothetical protein